MRDDIIVESDLILPSCNFTAGLSRVSLLLHSCWFMHHPFSYNMDTCNFFNNLPLYPPPLLFFIFKDLTSFLLLVILVLIEVDYHSIDNLYELFRKIFLLVT